jgi:hypothetical protein
MDIAWHNLLSLAFFVVFLIFTEPMNREISQWIPRSVPTNWTQVRNQWEYSHAARFVLQLSGLSALQISLLVETPVERLRQPVTPEVAQLTRR